LWFDLHWLTRCPLCSNLQETPFFPTSKEKAEQVIEKHAYSFLKMAEAERGMMQVFEQAIGVSPVVSDKWKEIREKFIQRIVWCFWFMRLIPASINILDCDNGNFQDRVNRHTVYVCWLTLFI
jgi:hypothetical protein